MSSEGRESAKKKQRIQEPGNSGNPQAEFHSLAFAIFVETADVSLLKICRLVCKAWNVAATDSLRNRSCVRLDEDEINSSEDFWELLADRAIGPSTSPSPFQNFYIVATSFSNECFNRLVNARSVVVTKLLLEGVWEELDQKSLGDFLAAKGDQIRTLQIKSWTLSRDFKINPVLLYKEGMRLAALKSVEFEEKCNGSEDIQFLKNCLLRASVDNLEVSMYDMNKLVDLLTPEVLQTLQSLRISFMRSLSAAGFGKIVALELPPLKSFKFLSLNERSDERHPVTADQIQRFASKIDQIAGTLEVLESNYIQVEVLPVCPKLREILVDGFQGKLTEFSSIRFPSLEKIAMKILPGERVELEDNFLGHGSVTDVKIHLMGSYSEQKSFSRKALHLLLKNLSHQFPNVVRFSLGMNEEPFNSGTFRSIHRAFPGLKHLGIDSPFDFFSLAGMEMSVVNTYLEKGWGVEGIHRKDSILDFQELESVTLVKLCEDITNDMIKYCLGKIPALKELTFYWNDTLSVEVLRDRLGHLKKIEIASPLGGIDEDISIQLKRIYNVQLLEDFCFI